MHREPNGEVEHDAYDGGGDRRESRIEGVYASKPLRKWSTQENPKKARGEGHPSGEQSPERPCQQRRKLPRVSERPP